MTNVGSRELKNRLGSYLKQVKRGKTLQVTDRGRPFARIVPIDPPEDEDEELFRRLAEKGSVTFGNGQPLSSEPPAEMTPGPLISEQIVKDRR